MIMKKEEKKSLEPSTGFFREPCQNLRVPFYEILPVSYFQCLVLQEKKTMK